MKNCLLIISIWLTSLPAYAQFTAGDSIPVRISYLDITRNGNTAELNWAVTCFLNFANFEVQRSADGAVYVTIHQFQADETRCRQPFGFSDPVASGKVFYRIRVGDIDGKFYSSKTVVAYGKTSGFDITAIIPSIINQTAVINISAANNDNILITITDANGSLQKSFRSGIQKGNNTIPLEIGFLQKGIYFISAVNNKNELRSIRIIKI